jgi:hypothetical protein
VARGESLVWSLGKGPGSIVLRESDARTLIDLPAQVWKSLSIAA